MIGSHEPIHTVPSTLMHRFTVRQTSLQLSCRDPSEACLMCSHGHNVFVQFGKVRYNNCIG